VRAAQGHVCGAPIVRTDTIICGRRQVRSALVSTRPAMTGALLGRVIIFNMVFVEGAFRRAVTVAHSDRRRFASRSEYGEGAGAEPGAASCSRWNRHAGVAGLQLGDAHAPGRPRNGMLR
jgi:hypothetical protein